MTNINDLLQEALSHHQSGNLAAAEPLYQKILDENPNQFEALFLLGSLNSDLGRLEIAETMLKNAIAANPDYAEAHNNLAVAYLRQSKLNEAIESFKETVRCQPDLFEAHFYLGIIYQQTGRYDDAAKSYQSAIAHKPDYAQARYNLGLVFHEQGNLNEARKCYSDVLKIKPDFVEARNNLGDTLQKSGKIDDAIFNYRKALDLKPDYAEAHYNLGIALQEKGDIKNAVESYKSAIQHKPDYAQAHYNMGIIFNDDWMLDKAESCYKQAIDAEPNYAEALNNQAEVYQRQGKLDKAIESYTRAIECKPDYIMAKFNRSIAYLVSGDFEKGWRDYEHRLLVKKYNKRSFKQPQWDGSPLQNRTLLVHAEQGFGDTFQFARFLPNARAMGGKVIFECQKNISTLLKRCAGFDEIIEKSSDEAPDVEFDTFAPLMSLAGIFRANVETIPTNIPYIFPDPELAEKWNVRLSSLASANRPEIANPFKVGVVWGGKPERKYDRVRSCPLQKYAPLFEIPNAVFFSLQKDDAAKQINELQKPGAIVNLENDLDNSAGFVDTAAVIANMDLVISIDSAITHLSGAIGKPTWTMLPYAHDWRWLTNRDDSPWYPTVRLFRQPTIHDWETVINRVAEELKVLTRDRT